MSDHKTYSDALKILFGILFLLSNGICLAQKINNHFQLHIRKTDQPVVIDGLVDDKAWDEAVAKGWTVVSMKDDWKTIFPK